jgi:two-component system cell cycle sensor histidine kinase/response regulator CckA
MDTPLKVLVIDVDDTVALLMRKHLERAGHQVSSCRTAADALIVVLGQSQLDLILLEQNLPDMDGLDLLLKFLREGVSVPVLMVTAHANVDLATKVLQAGALDYIAKDPDLYFLNDLPKRVVESVARHRLEQMNQLLVQSLESARDGIMITDLVGTILNVNKALEQMTGYSRQELVGQTPDVFKSGGNTAEGPGPMWRTILARHSWQGELTNRRKDGALYQTSVTISPIVDRQGRLTHFVAIERDVTEHKQLERQLLQAQKMQSVGTLAGGVAHEFNNLLAGINGYAYLGLREPGVEGTLQEFLQNIVALSERAATLTRQLLAFARKPPLTRRRLAVGDLIRETVDLIQRTLHQDVALEGVGSVTDGGQMLVEADAIQLQQAIVNLALNARDAILKRDAVAGSPGGTAEPAVAPAIAIRVRPIVLMAEQAAFPQHVSPGDYVVLEVQDRGVGMTPQVLSQALDPFFTTKDVGQGTGLGLPMVFGIVQGHHGYLTIDSAVGRGTIVAIYLPRLAGGVEKQSTGTPPYGTEIVEPETTPGRTILVIDDEEAVVDVVRRFLQIAGHRVISATSGHDALDRLTEQPEVDLVILDLMMPREDAATTFHSLRQSKPSLPILLCTGLPDADPAPELLDSGAVGLLRKPFRMNELWYAVKQGLTAPVGPGTVSLSS